MLGFEIARRWTRARIYSDARCMRRLPSCANQSGNSTQSFGLFRQDGDRRPSQAV